MLGKKIDTVKSSTRNKSTNNNNQQMEKSFNPMNLTSSTVDGSF